MSAFADQLAGVAAAVEIVSPTRYKWLGEPSEPLPEHVERRLTAEDARGYLTYSLSNRLYSDFYCPGYATLPPPRATVDPVRGDPMLVEALSRSNGGGGCWEPGWRLVAREGAEVVVERGGLVLRAAPQECRGLPEGGGAADEGVELELLYPKEMLRISPGFYMATAARPFDDADGLVRLYWNLSPAGAVQFVREATRLVDEAGFGARLKVANHPALYDRCDAGVLYLPMTDALVAGDLVRALHRAVAGHLAPRVPAFTRRLAAGVGLAEDPGGGQSFGQSRCGLVAEGLVRAYERGIGEPAARVEVVRERMAEDGLDPDAPYLNAESTEDYEMEIDELAAEPAG
jgi:hypothetical protein